MGIDGAAVLDESTDARPDNPLAGKRFDVKTTDVRLGNSFASSMTKADSGIYDALLLAQHIRQGFARVWCRKCQLEGGGEMDRSAR